MKSTCVEGLVTTSSVLVSRVDITLGILSADGVGNCLRITEPGQCAALVPDHM